MHVIYLPSTYHQNYIRNGINTYINAQAPDYYKDAYLNWMEDAWIALAPEEKNKDPIQTEA